MKKTQSFTKANGIKIQQNDLLAWRGVLNPSAYSKIEAKCQESNEKVNPGPQAGHLILRGTMILNMVNCLVEGVDLKEPLTTSQAFQRLSSVRGWYKTANINKDTARSLKRHFNNGDISEWRMSEILKAAGYVVTEAVWNAPDHISDAG